MFSIFHSSRQFAKYSLRHGSKIILTGKKSVLAIAPIKQQIFHFSKSGDKEIKSVDSSIDELEKKIDELAEEPEKKKSKGDKKLASKATPKIEIRIVPGTYNRQSYDQRNLSMGRVLSPHLSIYRKQLTSVMSIFLRISGFVLGIGIWIVGITALCSQGDINSLAEKIKDLELSESFLKVLKFCLVLPFAYHVAAGTRHLIWYLNVFLSKPAIYVTGYVALAVTFLLASSLTCMRPEEIQN